MKEPIIGHVPFADGCERTVYQTDDGRQYVIDGAGLRIFRRVASAERWRVRRVDRGGAAPTTDIEMTGHDAVGCPVENPETGCDQ